MSSDYKKSLLKRLTYIPKEILTHKHNYTIKCILEITNKNIHATGNYYNHKDYYEVLKCDNCSSFIPLSKEGNISGTIFDDNYIDKSIPLIKANTYQKCPSYDFCDLEIIDIDKYKKREVKYEDN